MYSEPLQGPLKILFVAVRSGAAVTLRPYNPMTRANGAPARIGTNLMLYRCSGRGDTIMNNIIWIIGAIVVILAVLSFFGLR